MKKLTIFLIAITFFANAHVMSAEKGRSLLEKLMNRDLPGGEASSVKKANEILDQKIPATKKTSKICKEKKLGGRSLLEKALNKDLPGGNARKDIDINCSPSNEQVKMKTDNKNKFLFNSSDTGQNFSIYAGTFDLIDKEGDEKTSLFGIEHKNKDLFRNTWIGRFSPTTGAFVTGKNSVYLYTGIEADYKLGPVNISPSFAPGYYEAGDGKNLGSALEFKSEIKIGVNLFKDANLGYSYSHISNNDFGDINPGTDNQSINLSKKF